MFLICPVLAATAFASLYFAFFPVSQGREWPRGMGAQWEEREKRREEKFTYYAKLCIK